MVGKIEGISCLWYAYDSKHYEQPVGVLDVEEIYRIVDERRNYADALILMAHEELRDDFAPYFSEKEFGNSSRFDFIDKGRADYFCIAEKSNRLIPEKSWLIP